MLAKAFEDEKQELKDRVSMPQVNVVCTVLSFHFQNLLSTSEYSEGLLSVGPWQ